MIPKFQYQTPISAGNGNKINNSNLYQGNFTHDPCSFSDLVKIYSSACPSLLRHHLHFSPSSLICFYTWKHQPISHFAYNIHSNTVPLRGIVQNKSIFNLRSHLGLLSHFSSSMSFATHEPLQVLSFCSIASQFQLFQSRNVCRNLWLTHCSLVHVWGEKYRLKNCD